MEIPCEDETSQVSSKTYVSQIVLYLLETADVWLKCFSQGIFHWRTLSDI